MQTKSRAHATLPLALGLAILAFGADAASADHLGRKHDGDAPYVRAESRHGNGSISGPVRQVSTGHEVRLPGGTWMPCGRSCSETLRRETVDFWENHSQGKHEGAGYLNFKFGW